MKKIRVAELTLKPIPITPSTLEPLDPAAVAAALGGEPCPEIDKTGALLGPITLYAVRMELFRRLQSRGGQSDLEGNNLRAKIPLSDQDWHKLEELAVQIASLTGLSPSPGQVGSVLLSLALWSVTFEGKENGGVGATALMNELAARGAT